MARESEGGREISDLRERVVRLEVKLEELSKRSTVFQTTLKNFTIICKKYLDNLGGKRKRDFM